MVVCEHCEEHDGLIVFHLPFVPTSYFGLYNVVIYRISKYLYLVTCRCFDMNYEESMFLICLYAYD